MILRRIENEPPLEMLLARQDEADRLVMRVDQEQKRFVADGLPFETKHVDGVAVDDEWRSGDRFFAISRSILRGCWATPHPLAALLGPGAEFRRGPVAQ